MEINEKEEKKEINEKIEKMRQSFLDSYSFNDEEKFRLENAFESFRIAELAAKRLEKEGLTIVTKQGEKAHPLLTERKSAINLYLRTLYSLGIDKERRT